jgi:hypothetical protein
MQVKSLAIKVKSYPRHKPTLTKKIKIEIDSELASGPKNVSVTAIVYTKKEIPGRLINSAPDGASAFFLDNAAEEHNPKQFGLKFFYHCATEAYCAWKRQQLAAEVGLAPPVGKMIVLMHGNRILYYGYQTAVADTDFYVSQKLVNKLSKNLEKINIPKDYCVDCCSTDDDDGNPVYDSVLGDDLHENNYAIWQGNLVCIDFGSDSLSAS